MPRHPQSLDAPVRAAQPSDVPALVAMWQVFMRDQNTAYVRTVRLTAENRQRMAEHLGKLIDVHQVFVVEADGELAGFTAMVANLPPLDLFYTSATITDLYVREPYRGRGWGKALLERAVAEIRDRGLDVVKLLVRSGNPAKQLYQAVGFQTTTEEMLLPLVNGAVRLGPGHPQNAQDASNDRGASSGEPG